MRMRFERPRYERPKDRLRHRRGGRTPECGGSAGRPAKLLVGQAKGSTEALQSALPESARGWEGWPRQGVGRRRDAGLRESGASGLFGEDDADGGLVFLGAGLDADDVAAQAQRLAALADAGVVEEDFELGLQARRVLEGDEGAMEAEVADHGLFFKRAALSGESGDASAEEPVAWQSIVLGATSLRRTKCSCPVGRERSAAVGRS